MMGHRVVKRVPLDFDHPLSERWPGYLMPDPGWPTCSKCGGDGIHPHAKPIERSFYALEIGDEETRRRVCWNDKITQGEVDHLLNEGRLRTWVKGENGERGHWEKLPRTADEVNALNRGMGIDSHDGINRWILVQYRCEKLGIPYACDMCAGHGDIATDEQRTEYEKWEPTEPPVGEAWQLWETTSEGSPVSPVFASAETLADWCADNATPFASIRWTASQWLSSFKAETTDVDTLLVMRGPERVSP